MLPVLRHLRPRRGHNQQSDQWSLTRARRRQVVPHRQSNKHIHYISCSIIEKVCVCVSSVKCICVWWWRRLCVVVGETWWLCCCGCCHRRRLCCCGTGFYRLFMLAATCVYQVEAEQTLMFCSSLPAPGPNGPAQESLFIQSDM